MNAAQRREVQQHLRRCGWPISADGVFGPKTHDALREFQRGLLSVKIPVKGWTRVHLRQTGRATWGTRQALKRAVAQDGHCSKHFRFSEWKSNGNGWIKVNRKLLKGLERYRRKVDHAITIVSGYRDPAYNKSVGGVPDSQHLDGDAADLVPELSVEQVKNLKAFNGIGYQQATGKVRHVDVGHTAGSNKSPVLWAYS